MLVRNCPGVNAELSGTATPAWHKAIRKASRWAGAESTRPIPLARTGSITPPLRSLFRDRSGGSRVVRRAAGDDKCPGNDDEQEPREPRGSPGEQAEAQPGDEQQRADRGPRCPGCDPLRADRALTAPVQGRAASGAGTCRARRSGPDGRGGQPVQVDAWQVGEERVEVAHRPRPEHLVQAVVELRCVQPARGVVFAEQRCGALPVRVRGAHPRVTGHRGRSPRRWYPGPAEPVRYVRDDLISYRPGRSAPTDLRE